jgi:hypothetical protein
MTRVLSFIIYLVPRRRSQALNQVAVCVKGTIGCVDINSVQNIKT